MVNQFSDVLLYSHTLLLLAKIFGSGDSPKSRQIEAGAETSSCPSNNYGPGFVVTIHSIECFV
jgi:hypothetical protein|tara:strand:- start:202 stop:390 length:189 start_codon:yes stop_codon:yes gene_type:complete